MPLLHHHASHPMPPGTRGALVLSAPASPDQPIRIRWLTDSNPPGPGQILLHWEPSSEGWHVQAHLGHATGPTLLANWPHSPDHWPDITRPTLHEVRSLYAALRVTTRTLDHALALPVPG